jgi:TonB family protein
MSSRASVSTSTSNAVRLAEEYLLRGDLKEALSIYRVVWETDPGNPAVRSRLTELCGLAEQNPASIAVLAEAARIHIEQRDTASAIASLNRASKLGPCSDPDTLMEIAGLCSRCGLRGEAERYYLKAADIYESNEDPAKLEAAYKSAADVAPANAEVHMKLGALCHRRGRVEDSYRAFMKAAAEYNKRGDDGAALDAYGKAVKVGLAGAEAGNVAAQALTESPAEQPGIEKRPTTGDLHHDPAPLPVAAAEVQQASPDGKVVRPTAKPESGDSELLARKIATAEMMFGFGRPDRAIALLKDLLGQEPNDSRIHLKLKDIYLRSRMPQDAARVYRELARIYRAEGNRELAADCLENAQRLSGQAVEPKGETSPTAASVARAPASAPVRIVLPASKRAATQVPMPAPGTDDAEMANVILVKPAAPGDADYSAASFGVRLRTANTQVREPGKRRLWLAGLVVVVISGLLGIYVLIQRNRPASSIPSDTALAQVEPTATVESPVEDIVPESQGEPRSDSGRRVENQGRPPANRFGSNSQEGSVDRGAQAASEAQSNNSNLTQDGPSRKAEKPNATPPPVGPIASSANLGSGSLNIAPSGLSAQVEVPAPPPAPVVRRSAVMAGGEVVRRVSPSYPQAARSAHITGTVTVEISINEQGNVISARATSGPGMLAGAAESAARGFKFKPITLDGVPVKSNRTVLFHFKE